MDYHVALIEGKWIMANGGGHHGEKPKPGSKPKPSSEQPKPASDNAVVKSDAQKKT